MASGTFREDLFFRLAVAVLTLPPVRERQGDVGFLLDQLFQKVNAESSKDSGQKQKILSAGAKNVLVNHSWPGNVRELLNTLRRLVIWADGTIITSEDAREALLQLPSDPDNSNGHPLGDGFSLQDLLKATASHYLQRAMDEAHGNKTKAAELLGLPSYQTLTNWLSRYEVKR
jgi:transcriptional regulator with PAS, ATPase and Fis domain